MTKAKITTYRVCIIFKYMPDMSQWGMGEGDVVDSLYLSKSVETFLTSMYSLIIILSESHSVVSNSLFLPSLINTGLSRQGAVGLS